MRFLNVEFEIEGLGNNSVQGCGSYCLSNKSVIIKVRILPF